MQRTWSIQRRVAFDSARALLPQTAALVCKEWSALSLLQAVVIARVKQRRDAAASGLHRCLNLGLCQEEVCLAVVGIVRLFWAQYQADRTLMRGTEDLMDEAFLQPFIQLHNLGVLGQSYAVSLSLSLSHQELFLRLFLTMASILAFLGEKELLTYCSRALLLMERESAFGRRGLLAESLILDISRIAGLVHMSQHSYVQAIGFLRRRHVLELRLSPASRNLRRTYLQYASCLNKLGYWDTAIGVIRHGVERNHSLLDRKPEV